jgi:hypothetical protein
VRQRLKEGENFSFSTQYKVVFYEMGVLKLAGGVRMGGCCWG